MKKKAYIQPICEDINVRLIGSVLDQGVIGNWSEVAAGDGGTSDTLEKASYYGAGAGKYVCIDPGHQLKGNSSTEPVGPGSDEMKAKVSSGTAGTVTGITEYQFNLDISLALRKELEARGYQVIMTHTTNEVDLSNVDRAEIANDAEVDAFVRIHANSSSNAAAHGIETLCMSSSTTSVTSTRCVAASSATSIWCITPSTT